MEKLKLVSSLPAAAKQPEKGPFEEGQTVLLKSGVSPPMCVQASGPIWTHVCWFDEGGNYIGPEEIKNTMLKIASPPEPPAKPKRTYRRKPKARR